MLVCDNNVTLNSFSSPWAALLLVSTIATSGRIRFSEDENSFRTLSQSDLSVDSEHSQSDGKSVNRGRPVLDPARGRDSWC